MITKIKTINKSNTNKIEVKKSVFIATIERVNSEEEAKEKLDEIRSKYKDATHNVPCYRVYDKDKNMIIERCNDDGEPQGTSGKPMLDVLKHKDLLNTLVVVTRYFGGTLLGTGGLVKAYQDSIKEVIDNSEIVELSLKDHYSIKTNYDTFNKLKQRLESLRYEIENISYNIDITFDLYVPINENDNGNKNLDNLLNEFDENIIVKKLNAVFS